MDVIIVHFVFVAFLFSDFNRYGVGKLRMSISSSPVVLGSTAPVNTTFTCGIDSGISIEKIYLMQILRMRDSLDIKPAPICHALSSGVGFANGVPTDILERGTVGGGLDNTTYTNSTLTFTLTTEDIVCSDKGTYQCKIGYEDSQTSHLLILVNNARFETYVLPHAVNLTARVNNVDVEGTKTDPLDVNVNDAVEFTCTAMIGSDNTTRIRWRRTSALETTNVFNQYNPAVGTFSDGTSSTTMTDCSYSRTATMTYNVTSVETCRLNDLAFQCYIEVTVNGVTYKTNNPPEFYIKPVIVTTLKPSSTPVTITTMGPATTTEYTCGKICFILLITCCVIGGVAAVIATVMSCYFRSGRGIHEKEGSSVAFNDDSKRHRYVNTSLDGDFHLDVRQNHSSRVDVTETSYGHVGETGYTYEQLHLYSNHEEHPYLRRN